MKKFLVLACVASFAMIVGCDDDTDNNKEKECQASCSDNIRYYCDAAGKLATENCGAAGCNASTLQCNATSSGGNEGGNSGGNEGGNSGGNEGGNEGGNSGGNEGGNSGGNEGGNSGSTPNVGDACNIMTDSDYCNGSTAIYCNGNTSKYVAYDCSQDAEEGYSPVCVTIADYYGDGVTGAACVDKKEDACTESDVESAVGFCEENESYTWVCLETSGGYMYVFDSTETCDDGCDSDGISCK